MSATVSPVEHQTRTSSQIILGVFVPHIIWIFLFEYLIYQTFRPTYFPLSVLAGAGRGLESGISFSKTDWARSSRPDSWASWEIFRKFCCPGWRMERFRLSLLRCEILPGSLPPSHISEIFTAGNYNFLLSICWTWNCYWILINERKRSKHGTEGNLL